MILTLIKRAVRDGDPVVFRKSGFLYEIKEYPGMLACDRFVEKVLGVQTNKGEGDTCKFFVLNLGSGAYATDTVEHAIAELVRAMQRNDQNR